MKKYLVPLILALTALTASARAQDNSQFIRAAAAASFSTYAAQSGGSSSSPFAEFLRPRASDPRCSRVGQVYYNTSTSKQKVCTATGNPGTWADVGSAATGDVTGPASSTDNAIARFDGTGGKTLQNSTVTVGDTGNVAGVGTLNAHTIPGGTDTFTLNAATQTFTNKSFALGSNTLSGTLAQFNTAVTDADLARTDSSNTFASTQTFSGDISLGANKLIFTQGLIKTSGTNTLMVRNNADSAYGTWEAGKYRTLDSGGNIQIGLSQTSAYVVELTSAGEIQWATSGTQANTAKNVGLGWLEAGAVKFTNGSTGGGTFKIGDPGTKPSCDSAHRGMFWIEEGGAGVADTVEVCSKDAADAYAWRAIY
jgi:hypothetical protein